MARTLKLRVGDRLIYKTVREWQGANANKCPKADINRTISQNWAYGSPGRTFSGHREWCGSIVNALIKEQVDSEARQKLLASSLCARRVKK